MELDASWTYEQTCTLACQVIGEASWQSCGTRRRRRTGKWTETRMADLMQARVNAGRAARARRGWSGDRLNVFPRPVSPSICRGSARCGGTFVAPPRLVSFLGLPLWIQHRSSIEHGFQGGQPMTTRPVPCPYIIAVCSASPVPTHPLSCPRPAPDHGRHGPDVSVLRIRTI